MNFFNSDHAISDRDISQFEIDAGMKLPRDLAEFYSLNNGGRPPKRLYTKADDGFLIHYFIPLSADIDNADGGLAKAFRTWDAVGGSRILSRSLPIAYDENGNNLLYSLDKGSFGSIFYTQSDCDESDQIRYLCASLAEFLAGLQEWA